MAITILSNRVEWRAIVGVFHPVVASLRAEPLDNLDVTVKAGRIAWGAVLAVRSVDINAQ